MILAAGAGSRLGNLAEDCPKPMLDVGGRPILDHILANLVRHGFTDVVINLHHLPRAIPAHFGDGSTWGASITYVHEPALLGTAGSVKNAEALFQPDAPILVHYGDVLTDQDLGAMLTFHLHKGAGATLLAHQRTRSNSILCLDSQGRVERILERPTEEERQGVTSTWVNSGVYLFHPRVLQRIPEGVPSDFPRDIFPRLIQEDQVWAFPLSGYRCAIDSPARLEQARRDFALQNSEA